MRLFGVGIQSHGRSEINSSIRDALHEVVGRPSNGMRAGSIKAASAVNRFARLPSKTITKSRNAETRNTLETSRHVIAGRSSTMESKKQRTFSISAQ